MLRQDWGLELAFSLEDTQTIDKAGHLMENFFAKLKPFHGIATRDEPTDRAMGLIRFNE